MTTFTREDYEMAAKAAGLRIKWIGEVAHDCTKLKPDAPAFKGSMWNPPEDDGDALRLAVKLNLLGSPELFHFRSLERFGRQDADDITATRRAIFRAAIAIGRAMP